MALRRLPNGYGGISKLSGNRRRPYMAYINTTVTSGADASDIANKIDSIDIDSITGDELLSLVYEVPNGRTELEKFIRALRNQCEFKAKYKKVALGYFATYKEATICLADYNRSPYDASKSHTFAEVYSQAYIDSGIGNKSQSTITAYNYGFNRCEPLHGKSIKDIKLVDLQEIIDSCAGQSRSTQNIILNVFRLVYQFAIKHDLAYKDYSQYVHHTDATTSKTKSVFTEKEINLLWDNKEKEYRGFKIAELLLVMIYTGTRISEVLSVTLDDIDGDIIHVKGTKTKASDRYVPVHPLVQPIVESLCRSNKKYLFEHKGQQVRHRYLRASLLPKWNEEFGMDHTFHETRHSFATYSTNMDSLIRSYIIGHNNNNITDDTYTHPEMLLTRLREEILKLDICL